MSDSLQSHRQGSGRLFCLRNFLGKHTGVDCHFLLQGILLIQGLNPCLLHWQVDSLSLSHQGSPVICYLSIFLKERHKSATFSFLSFFWGVGFNSYLLLSYSVQSIVIEMRQNPKKDRQGSSCKGAHRIL